MNGFCQQTLDIASSILNAMKGTLNMLPNVAEKPVKFGWILECLVGPFGRPDPITSLLVDVGLPIIPDKAFIAENIAVCDPLHDDFSGLALIGIGRHQVGDYRQAIQHCQHVEFVPEVVQIPRCTMPASYDAR